METQTAIEDMTALRICRIVLRDIGNSGGGCGGGSTKRKRAGEYESAPPAPKRQALPPPGPPVHARAHSPPDSEDSGLESSGDENIFVSEDEAASVCANGASAVGHNIAVDGLKTYLQLEPAAFLPCPPQALIEDANNHEPGPTTQSPLVTPGNNWSHLVTEPSSSGVDSIFSPLCASTAEHTIELSVPVVSPPPVPTLSRPMPKQYKERSCRYRGLNKHLRRIFGQYRKLDQTPKTLFSLRQENGGAEQSFPNPNNELFGAKPNPRFVALTAALKIARGRKDHRDAWVETTHIDLRKTSLLNRLLVDFRSKRLHYERLYEAIRGSDVTITKSLDHCIVEEISDIDPDCTWQELRNNAFKTYMSPGGQGYERRAEKLAMRKRAKAERRRRQNVDRSRKGLDFDPDMFFTKGDAALQFQIAE